MQVQPSAATDASHAVECAAAQLLLVDGAPPPPWFETTIDDIAGMVAGLWRERRQSPGREQLSTAIDHLCKAIEAMEEQCRSSPLLSAIVLRRLLPDPQVQATACHLRRDLSRPGQADSLTRFGWPSPKLLVATAATGLHRQIIGFSPSATDPNTARFCASLLGWARERAADPAPVMDERWLGALRAARRVYAGNVVVPVNWMNYATYDKAKQRDHALITARRLIDLVIAGNMWRAQLELN
jgi:hypothetical protein